ncbi:ABC transporter substrate-binding protein [Chitinimonas arctica]|uniref:ABC transporter substrate-binding protein n=1 Tax=Chitinimonas arctica TaxID=2594795 RepID=A0A516SA02_9NEIS|nr:ABC transporter substrate-binding protein [Chitinimonas arctica]QDQ24979.1 ABC transporter substrate-binding protein [Chitinimonas arctica]
MKRRTLLQAGLGLALGSTLTAGADASRRKRVMLLLYRGLTAAEQGFMDYLRARLEVEFIVRDAGSDKSRLAGMVEEARQLRPDLIYTFGTSVTVATVGTFSGRDPKLHISDIPVVFNIVADPVGAGLAPDTQSSLRNLTGVSHLAPPAAQWQALRRFGSPRKLAILYSPNEKNAVLAAARLATLARQDGGQVQAEAIATAAGQAPDPASLQASLARLLASQPDWLYLPSDSFLIANAAAVVQQAHQAGVAVFAATEEPVRQAGALAGLVSPYYAAGQFAAHKAAQILNGKKKAAELPLDTLARFTYLIHIGSARVLRRYPPLGLLRYAEIVGS